MLWSRNRVSLRRSVTKIRTEGSTRGRENDDNRYAIHPARLPAGRRGAGSRSGARSRGIRALAENGPGRRQHGLRRRHPHHGRPAGPQDAEGGHDRSRRGGAGGRRSTGLSGLSGPASHAAGRRCGPAPLRHARLHAQHPTADEPGTGRPHRARRGRSRLPDPGPRRLGHPEHGGPAGQDHPDAGRIGPASDAQQHAEGPFRHRRREGARHHREEHDGHHRALRGAVWRGRLSGLRARFPRRAAAGRDDHAHPQRRHHRAALRRSGRQGRRASSSSGSRMRPTIRKASTRTGSGGSSGRTS